MVDVVVNPTCLPLAAPSDPLCLHAPWDARLSVPEVSFSDDRHLFGKTPEGLHRSLTRTVTLAWRLGKPRTRSS